MPDESGNYKIRRRSKLVADSPSPGGRELEGGGNSPSPYSSPVKGEGISAEIATPSACNDNKGEPPITIERGAMTLPFCHCREILHLQIL